MSKSFWFTSILAILVSATLIVGFSPAAHAQKAAPDDNTASTYNTVPPQGGYYCPMGTGYPYISNSPEPGYKTGYVKRGGNRGSWQSGRQGYNGPQRMGCNWY